ncbi:hypothetical protein BpHYR1_047291, partial [Brachionus plicatilis]
GNQFTRVLFWILFQLSCSGVLIYEVLKESRDLIGQMMKFDLVKLLALVYQCFVVQTHHNVYIVFVYKSGRLIFDLFELGLDEIDDELLVFVLESIIESKIEKN